MPANGSVHSVANLDAVAQCAGFPLLGHLRVRFQHYGGNVTGDGRTYDNVRLSQQDLGHFQLSHRERNISEGGSASVSVERFGDLGTAATVDFEVRAITATTGTDVTTNEGVAGTLPFRAGLAEVTLNITTVQDLLPENTETAVLVLKNPSGGAGLGATFQTFLRIVDNDQSPPGRQHFARTGSFAIPAVAAFPGASSGPPPITLPVSEVAEPVLGVIAKISDLSHAAPALLDIILESPTGSFSKLMSDVGEGVSPNSMTNLQFCFEDGSPALPTSIPVGSGTFAPNDAGPGTDRLLDNTAIGQTNTGTLSVFNGQSANGVWKLHIVEAGVGDSMTQSIGGGLLQGGYELVILTSLLPPLPVWTEAVTLLSGASRFSWIGQAGSVFTLQGSSNLKTWIDQPGYINHVMTGAVQRFTTQSGTFHYRWRRP